MQENMPGTMEVTFKNINTVLIELGTDKTYRK